MDQIQGKLTHAYAHLEKFDKGINCLNTAIEIDPSFSLLFNNRGLIYYKMGRNGKSISDFLQAIKLDSSQSIYYANIALPFFDKEEYQMGCIDLKKASSMGLNIESMGQIGERISQNCNF